jgi:transposase
MEPHDFVDEQTIVVLGAFFQGRQLVSGTNNEAERTLRGSAEARKTGRTSKTRGGARRQTIVVSVLESLRLYLPTFTLAAAIAEIDRWRQTGQSCFTALLKKLKLPPPGGTSILDKVMSTTPVPDG